MKQGHHKPGHPWRVMGKVRSKGKTKSPTGAPGTQILGVAAPNETRRNPASLFARKVET